jgi:hypothetical protein
VLLLLGLVVLVLLQKLLLLLALLLAAAPTHGLCVLPTCKLLLLQVLPVMCHAAATAAEHGSGAVAGGSAV